MTQSYSKSSQQLLNPQQAWISENSKREFEIDHHNKNDTNFNHGPSNEQDLQISSQSKFHSYRVLK